MSTIDIANFAAGIQDVPAFQGDRGGASRMVNYLVDPDGEVVPRPGYQNLSDAVKHISADGEITNTPQGGPLVVLDNSAGTRHFFRLPTDATYILSKDKLFFVVPDPPIGYWVDVSGTPTSDDIYQWTNKTDMEGDALRPSRDRVKPSVTQLSGGPYPRLPSHPTFVGLVGTPPNEQNPIEIIFRTGNRNIENFAMSVKMDEKWSGDNIFQEWGPSGNANRTLQAEKTYVFTWDGTDGNYTNAVDAFGNTVGDFIEDYWLWIALGPIGAAIDWLFVPDPDQYQGGQPIREISQEEFENCYIEMSYTLDGQAYKYRYYLYSHRGSDVGGQVAASLQAGLQIGQIGVQAAGPYGAIPGAAVAVAGTAGALLNKAAEGVRVELGRGARQLEASAKENGGFQHGQIVFCYTYSFDPDRFIESIPSRTSEILFHNFQELQSGTAGRTRQRIQFLALSDTVKTGENGLFDWANYINIYAARTDSLDADNKLPQETGLDFQLVKQYALADMPHGFLSEFWVDEELYDPSIYMECLDNDLPTRTLAGVTSYASRVWGVDRDDNSIRYSKLSPNGYHFFPSENALIPQVLTLDDDNSPIVKIHAASNDSMLYVFKSDVIHILRGHGEIRGLYNPDTPISIDLDASVKIENTGTLAPRSVCTVKNLTLFVGSDRILYSLSGVQAQPFSLSIQPYLEKLSDAALADIFAFEYRNCYHLCLPTETLVLDLQKGYWVVFDWMLKDAFWAQRAVGNHGNAVFALDTENNFRKLYTEGTENTEGAISCVWESNPIQIPPNGLVSGIYVIHDETQKNPLNVSLKVDNGLYQARRYTPSKANRFKQGFHARGQRVQVKIEDTNSEKLRIDRIQLEIQP